MAGQHLDGAMQLPGTATWLQEPAQQSENLHQEHQRHQLHQQSEIQHQEQMQQSDESESQSWHDQEACSDEETEQQRHERLQGVEQENRDLRRQVLELTLQNRDLLAQCEFLASRVDELHEILVVAQGRGQ